MTTVENQTKTYELELHFKRPLFDDMFYVSQSADVVTCLRESICSGRISYKEFFWIVLLNRANRVIGISEIASGNTDAVHINIKEILQLALLSNASSIILAHNHPSGRLQPSSSDTKITNHISKSLKLIDIDLLDHIIITQEDFYSLYEHKDFIRP